MKRLFLPLCFLMYVSSVAHSLAQAPKESCDIPLVVTRFVPSSRTVEVVKDVEAVGMWESRRDLQEEWEGWKAGLLAFHAFHSSAFPKLTCFGGCANPRF
jgi:hypothetical protein